jgi:protein SCO1/2
MDPQGKFVDAFGRSMGPEEVQGKIGKYLDEWKAGGGRAGWTE